MVLANHSERGSAIYFIFMAIALLGILSWAMLGASRTSLRVIQAEQEKAQKITVSTCTTLMAAASKRLALRKCDFISYASNGSNPLTPDGTCSMFSVNGGGLKPCSIEADFERCEAILPTLAIGETCSSIIYLGNSGKRVYTTLTDIGRAAFSSGGDDWSNATDASGTVNTTRLLENHEGGPFMAALMCRTLGDKWSVPHQNGLAFLTTAAAAPKIRDSLKIGPLAAGGGYWASREVTRKTTNYRWLSSPTAFNPTSTADKKTVMNIRCFRN